MLLLFTDVHARSNHHSSLAAAARKAIELETVRFTGAPAVDDDGELWIPHPAQIQYVGDPSPMVDEAWNNLTTSV